MFKYLKEQSSACQMIALSSKAVAAICAEACEHNDTETGGILLGHYVEGVWFVIEVVDPGLTVTRKVAEFSYDADYVNHLFKKVARTYKYPLKILGIWHRHPGSLDHFSGVDDMSHKDLVEFVGNGLVSMLVNFDPDFRITAYYADKNVDYHTPILRMGDEFIVPDLMKPATVEEIHRQYDIPFRAKKEDVVTEQVSEKGPSDNSNQVEVSNGETVNAEVSEPQHAESDAPVAVCSAPEKTSAGMVDVFFYAKGGTMPRFVCRTAVESESLLQLPEGYSEGYDAVDMETGDPWDPLRKIGRPVCIFLSEKP